MYYFNTIKNLPIPIKFYTFGIISVFSTSFVLNNYIIFRYRDYYHFKCNNIFSNFMEIYLSNFPMFYKSLINGFFWPYVVCNFIYCNDKQHNYSAYKHIIPWTTNKHIVDLNNF
jgi:hypothetical protein